MSTTSTFPAVDPADLTALREELRKVANLPLEEARTLPPAAYRSAELAELERTRIFREGWICIGRADEIPNAGDYRTDTVDGQPVVAIRQKDGTVRVFLNVCLHRFATLVTGAGHASGPIVCPYHGWSYSTAGRLLATPYASVQNQPACKSGEMRLKEVAAEIWGGFLFVSLAAEPEELSPQLDGLLDHLPGVAMERYRNVTVHDEQWNFNWKMLTENFIESYHLFMVHRTSLEPLAPTRNCIMVEGGDAYAIHYCPMIEDAGPELAHETKPGVPEGARTHLFDFVVFPSFMVAGSHNWLWWMSLQPLGPDQVKVRWGTSLTPELIADEAYASYGAELDAFVALANSEDKVALDRVKAGADGPLSTPGMLTPLDRPIWEFIRYLDRALQAPERPRKVVPFERSAVG